MPCAAAEAVAVGIEGQAGDENPVDLIGLKRRTLGRGLGDTEGAGSKVGVGVADLMQSQAFRDAIDPRAGQPPTAIEHVSEQGSGVQFLGKGRDVEQDGAGRGQAGKVVEAADQLGFLTTAVSRFEGQNTGDYCLSEGTLAGPEIGRLHRTPIVADRNKRGRPAPALVERERAEKDLHRNAVWDAFENPQLISGSLWPPAVAGGLCDGSRRAAHRFDKRPSLREHGRGTPGLSRTWIS